MTTGLATMVQWQCVAHREMEISLTRSQQRTQTTTFDHLLSSCFIDFGHQQQKKNTSIVHLARELY